MSTIKKAFLAISCLTVSLGCQNKNKAQSFLLSSNKDSLIIGAYMLTKNDTSGVRLIFENVADPRISHKTKHYGESVYQSKMNAMQRISNLDPPQKITSEPNTIIIDFYRNWAVKSGYLNK